MRISSDEVAAIKQSAQECFGPGTLVRLFGSRAEDGRRGGDIDLHVVAGDPSRASLPAELDFREQLAERIGEQRVDIILRRPSDPGLPIDRIAIRKGILL